MVVGRRCAGYVGTDLDPAVVEEDREAASQFQDIADGFGNEAAARNLGSWGSNPR
jgi:hypothetical protein